MPFYKFDMTVPLSPELVTSRLENDLVEPHNFFSYFPISLESCFTREVKEFFVGKVKQNRFKINYIRLGRRNFFHPAIRGKITASGNGTSIDVLMFMNPVGAAFLAFWFCSGISLVLAGGVQPLNMFIGGLAFFIAGLVIALGWFCSDAMKAKKMLILLWAVEDTKIVVDTGSMSDKITCEKCGHFNARIFSKCLYCGAAIADPSEVTR